MDTEKFSKNVILVDADWLDTQMSGFSTYFSGQIGRQLSVADLALWLECAAADGGMTGDVQCIFLHGEATRQLNHFRPSRFTDELNDMAFNGAQGTYSIQCFPAVQQFTTVAAFVTDTLQLLLESKDTERIVVVCDTDTYGPQIQKLIDEHMTSTTAGASPKHITHLTFRPLQLPADVETINIGFSFLQSLGVRPNEL